MKTLILVRHAKSDWGNLRLKDFDRSLNERGLRDAPMMGQRLLSRQISVDAFISSTAKRAAQTSLLIANEIGFGENNIIWKDILYHAPPQIIEDVLLTQDNDHQVTVLVCHNPGITDYVTKLVGSITHDMPTCAICAIQFETENWAQLKTATTKLLFFDYPKNMD